MPPFRSAKKTDKYFYFYGKITPEVANSVEYNDPDLRSKAEEIKKQYTRSVAFLSSALREMELREPSSLREARNLPHWKEWKRAMRSEHDSLTANQTWTFVPRPLHRKPLSGRWVYKLKTGASGEILRYKARWVIRGFEQREGIDYNETFLSVVKPMSYRALFAIAAAQDLEIEQMDVKTAFLYGEIDEEVYIEQPPGFKDGERSD